MSKRFLASLAGLLLGASTAFSQEKDAQPAPSPEPAPAPHVVALPAHGIDTADNAVYPDRYNRNSALFTFDADYLLWFFGNSRNSNVIASTNILTAPSTNIVSALGDAEHAQNAPVSGGRVAFGYWQTEDNFWVPGGIRDYGAEAVFFFLGQRGFTVGNGQNPDLIRPFFDLNNRQESGFIVAAPGLATGEITGHVQANLWGAELNGWKNLCYNFPGTYSSVAMLAGLRFLSADESLQVTSTSVFNPVLPPASIFFPFEGNRLTVFDSFSTHNRFYGGQLGIAGKCYAIERLSLEADFKLALGVTSEDFTVVGNQFRTFANGSTATYTGGLLALPSNIGQFHRDKFAQVPEIDFKLSYWVTNHLTLSTGFETIYWSRIARPGEQIDRQIDITQIPNFPLNAGATPTGLGRPALPFAQSDLWALGLTFGAEIKW
jgi:hypothetical protein